MQRSNFTLTIDNPVGMDIPDATYMAFAPTHAFSVAFDQGWALRNGTGLDFHLNYSWRDDAQEVIYNLSNFGYQYNRPRTFGLDLKLNF